jgi:hypothetical protein
MTGTNPVLAKVRCPDCGATRTADLRSRYWRAVLGRPLAFFDAVLYHAFIVPCGCRKAPRVN